MLASISVKFDNCRLVRSHRRQNTHRRQKVFLSSLFRTRRSSIFCWGYFWELSRLAIILQELPQALTNCWQNRTRSAHMQPFANLFSKPFVSSLHTSDVSLKPQCQPTHNRCLLLRWTQEILINIINPVTVHRPSIMVRKCPPSLQVIV